MLAHAAVGPGTGLLFLLLLYRCHGAYAVGGKRLVNLPPFMVVLLLYARLYQMGFVGASSMIFLVLSYLSRWIVVSWGG